ncbi:MAG: Ca2+-binding RTX toxin-like protein [Halocynthiibacter sp.]|jgi:Ca2+-binding RTX toxin-like protein
MPIVSVIPSTFQWLGTSGDDFANLTFLEDTFDFISVDSGLGNDTVILGAGDDAIISAGGDNYVSSGDGNDFVSLGAGNDTVYAGRGDDFIVSTGGDNVIRAGHGNDTIITGDGNDYILGDKGRNDISAGGGNDTINTGDHTSTVDGGDGDDVIIARLKKGADHVLTGGAGADSFEFIQADAKKIAHVTITDFNLEEDTFSVDGIDGQAEFFDAFFSGTPSEYFGGLAEVNGSTEITIGNGDTITLLDVSVTDFITSMFEDYIPVVG